MSLFDNQLAIKVIHILFVALGIAVAHAHVFLVRNHSKLTGESLAALYPERAWVRIVYPILVVLWFLTAYPGSLYLSEGQYGAYILGGTFSSLAVLNGLFAILTGVCPEYPRRSRYCYVYDDEVEGIGLQLIALGVLTIMLGYLLAHLQARMGM